MSAPEGRFPPVYLLNADLGLLGSLDQRRDQIGAYLPILRRPGVQGAPVIGRESVAHLVFREAFVREPGGRSGDPVEEQLVADLRPLVELLWPEHAAQTEEALWQYIRAEKLELPDERERQALSALYDLDQRRYLLVMQRLVRDLLPVYMAERALHAMSTRPEIEPVVRAAAGAAAGLWAEDLVAVRARYCSPDDAHIEHDPHILALHLAEPPGGSLAAELDAYCHGDWGKTPGQVLRAVQKIAAYSLLLAAPMLAAPASVGALAAGTAAGAMTLPATAAALAGGAALSWSFVDDARRTHRAREVASALYAPTVAERDRQDLITALQLGVGLLALPASYAAIGAGVASGMAGPGALLPRLWGPVRWSLKDTTFYLIPMGMSAAFSAKKLIDNGKNPLLEPPFYTELLSVHLAYLAGATVSTALEARAAGAALAAGGASLTAPGLIGALLRKTLPSTGATLVSFLAADEYVQELRFLATGIQRDWRVSQRALYWVPRYTSLHVFALASIGTLIDAGVPRASAWQRLALHTAAKLIEGYVYYNLGFAVYARYLAHRNLTYSEAVATISPEDFKIWVRHDMCAAPSSEIEYRACAGLAGEDRSQLGRAPIVSFQPEELTSLQAIVAQYRGQYATLDAAMQALGSLPPGGEEALVSLVTDEARSDAAAAGAAPAERADEAAERADEAAGPEAGGR